MRSNFGSIAMGLVLVVALIGVWLMVHPETAYACSCGGKLESLSEALEGADAVFMGRVASVKEIRDHEDQSRIEFDVVAYWKGPVYRTMYVATRSRDSSCSYPFDKGEEYIVYGYYSERLEGLWTGFCTRTHPIVAGWRDFTEVRHAELGEGKEPGEGENASPWELRGGCSRSAGAVDLAFVGLLVGLVCFGRRKRRAESG